LVIPVTLKLFSTISGETEDHAASVHSHTVGNGTHFILPLASVYALCLSSAGCKTAESDLEWSINDYIQRLQKPGHANMFNSSKIWHIEPYLILIRISNLRKKVAMFPS
jgi:hypothetical protein